MRQTSLLLASGALGGVLFAERPVDAQVSIQLCDAKQQRCDGKCVPKSPQIGCGDKFCRSCVVVGAAPACESTGKEGICGYSKCFDGRVDLDGERTNGCEAIKVPYMVFQIPATYARMSLDGRVRYELSGVASGSMTQSGDKQPTGKSFSFTVPTGPTLTEIDRCFALAAALPASAKVWLEMHEPTTIYQIPYIDNSPHDQPSYVKVVLDVRDGPKHAVNCRVNHPPS